MNRQAVRKSLEIACGGKTVIVARNLEILHPLAERLAVALSKLGRIQFIKIQREFLSASSEVKGATRDPITKPGHPTATGIAMNLFWDFKSLDFYEINSAPTGYGAKMVAAVLSELPADWEADVFWDESDGFWERMRQRFPGIHWATERDIPYAVEVTVRE